MLGGPADVGGQSSTGGNEIDELLHDLVHRYEPEPESESEPDSHRAPPSAGRLRRGLPVAAVGGLLALVIAGFVFAGFVAGGLVFTEGESRPNDEATKSDGAGEVRDGAVSEATSPIIAPATPAPATPAPAAPSITQPPTAVSPLKVGIVLPGSVDDRAFSQSMVDGATTLLNTGGISGLAITDNIGSAGVDAEIRRFADEGYDLVIAHSSVFEGSVFEIAADYPEVTFAVAGATDPTTQPNVYTYTVAAEEGGYVLGALSAMLSADGVVGVVGPAEVGVSKRYVDGFRRGASDERADLVVLVTYTGSFTDAAAFATATERHLDQGAEVITGHGNDLDAAIGVAAEREAIWLGSQADQAPVAPGSVVASQVYHWEVVLRQIVAEIEADEVDGRHLSANLANGGIVIAYNDSQAPNRQIQGRLDRLITEIASGSLRPLDRR